MAPGTVAQIAPREQVSTEVEIFASPVLAQRAVERLGAENVQQHMRWRWDWARELPEQMTAWVKAQLFGWTITGFLLESLGVEQDLGGEADPSGDAAARIQESLTVSQILQTDVFLVEVRAPSPRKTSVCKIWVQRMSSNTCGGAGTGPVNYPSR